MTTHPTFGRYRVDQVVGKGAMGTVYKGYDPKIDRVVAVKTVSFQYVEESERKAALERFHLEARLAGKLAHPNIVTIFDVGEDFIAMEFLEGESLSQFLKSHGAVPAEEVLRICEGIAAALDHAHQHGIIHRDVKPANILLVGPQRHVKLTDFGIAKSAGLGMTATGHVLGTPNYMSPEQVMGETIDNRSDLFSLAVVCFELLTGKLPFGGGTLTTVAYKIVHAAPPPARELNPSISIPIEQFLLKALAKQPDQRFANGKAFMEAFRFAHAAGGQSPIIPTNQTTQMLPPPPPILAPSPNRKRSKTGLWVSLLLLVLLLISFGGFYLLQRNNSVATNNEPETFSESNLPATETNTNLAPQDPEPEVPERSDDQLNPEPIPPETQATQPETTAEESNLPKTTPAPTVSTAKPKPAPAKLQKPTAAPEPLVAAPAPLVFPVTARSEWGEDWGDLVDGVAMSDRLAFADRSGEGVRLVDPSSGRMLLEFDVVDEPEQMAADSKSIYLAIPSKGIARYKLDGKLDESFGKKGLLKGDWKKLSGLCRTDQGEFWVSDKGKGQILKINSEGKTQITIKGLKEPGHLILTPEDMLLVCDVGAHQLVGFNAKGERVLTLGGPGKTPGLFSKPQGLALHAGILAVADTGNNRIQLFDWPGTRFGSEIKTYKDAKLDEPVSVSFWGNTLLVTTLGRQSILVFTP
ncbi:MAG: protein kinase [Acidobacteria bacterium]|nr:protein kinase [Acidobacteriota bacterium]MCB9398312.1 protein kinase [Acidobacteriota bacterium]